MFMPWKDVLLLRRRQSPRSFPRLRIRIADCIIARVGTLQRAHPEYILFENLTFECLYTGLINRPRLLREIGRTEYSISLQVVNRRRRCRIRSYVRLIGNRT